MTLVTNVACAPLPSARMGGSSGFCGLEALIGVMCGSKA